jgi:hypothetical protein
MLEHITFLRLPLVVHRAIRLQVTDLAWHTSREVSPEAFLEPRPLLNHLEFWVWFRSKLFSWCLEITAQSKKNLSSLKTREIQLQRF